MMPIGLRWRTSLAVMRWGTISEYTCASRTRRAINWAYWAPKSTTKTVGCIVDSEAIETHDLS